VAFVYSFPFIFQHSPMTSHLLHRGEADIHKLPALSSFLLRSDIGRPLSTPSHLPTHSRIFRSADIEAVFCSTACTLNRKDTCNSFSSQDIPKAKSLSFRVPPKHIIIVMLYLFCHLHNIKTTLALILHRMNKKVNVC